MKFEWNAAKAATNIKKHGVSFEEAKSIEFGENKTSLLKWFVAEGVGTKLNIIRHEIITLINSEVGDGSGTNGLKSAIDSNNTYFKSLFSRLLE